ncbi:MAG: hypothetical protein CM1200mP25_1880 [Acidobacteriota bacterium]|nr:MAG: hypothetical protein CM1200mP25_1880 [Acidobacteriota bacterium]
MTPPVPARTNLPSSGHTSPLVLAIVNAHFELGEVLLEAGANPNFPGTSEGQAFMRSHGFALLVPGVHPLPTGNMGSLDLARSLLERGAEPNRQITWNEIPFEVDLGIVKPPPNISVGPGKFISFVGATPVFSWQPNTPMLNTCSYW